MRILVIGGTLFIGKLLVERLAALGHDVTVLHRRAGHALPVGVGELTGDRNDAASLARAFNGRRFDAVFDNVYDWQRGTTAEQVAVTAHLAHHDDLHRYVFMSSVAAYGSGLNCREDEPLAPDDDPDPYVRNKARSERALFRLHRETGFPVVTVRPPFIYGPGNPFYREQFFWDRLRRRRPVIVPEDGQRLMQFVFVRDLVEACVRVLDVEGAVGKAFNVAEPAPVTQECWVRSLAAAAGVEPDLRFVPRKRLLAAGGDPMAPPYYFAQYYDLPSITQDPTRLREVLQVPTTPREEGLRESHAWYLRECREPEGLDVALRWEDRFFTAS